ncbi:MAG: acyl-CoA synthetase FdrA [Anaerolineae bacterium]|nr:acyl-CoA synthetase FdrA [Anaerolineae bacterium]
MITQTLIKAGQYHDSVTLLQVAQTLLKLDGVNDAAVIMGTPANQSILRNADLLTAEAEAASPDDLVIAVRAMSKSEALNAIAYAEETLTASRNPATAQQSAPRPRSVSAAAKQLGDANIALVSVAGRYAGDVARQALQQNLHVFLFSDNVSVEDEIAIKQLGRERGLLVMGPDAGTAIINGKALGFANAILTTPPTAGGVGIVAASGTGLQAVTTSLARRGIGITQAIGTGGRDLSAKVGGIMMMEAIKALQADPATEILVLVSKPPATQVAQAVLETLRKSDKPTVVCFLGGKKQPIEAVGAIPAPTLERAAMIAAELATGGQPDKAIAALKERNQGLKEQARELKARLSRGQKCYRGLFSGGTFCYETQIILSKMLGNDKIKSNAPLNKAQRLATANVSEGHTAVDLGEDEFTVGRLHPMLDPALRNRRIVHEARDPDTAVVYIDVVLGYGVHPNPAGAAVEAIYEAQERLKRKKREVIFLAHVCGTDADPQNASRQVDILRQAGVIVMPSNAAAARLAGYILR